MNRFILVWCLKNSKSFFSILLRCILYFPVSEDTYFWTHENYYPENYTALKYRATLMPQSLCSGNSTVTECRVRCNCHSLLASLAARKPVQVFNRIHNVNDVLCAIIAAGSKYMPDFMIVLKQIHECMTCSSVMCSFVSKSVILKSQYKQWLRFELSSHVNAECQLVNKNLKNKL